MHILIHASSVLTSKTAPKMHISHISEIATCQIRLRVRSPAFPNTCVIKLSLTRFSSASALARSFSLSRCSTAWRSMARLVASRSGNIKISAPHSHLILESQNAEEPSFDSSRLRVSCSLFSEVKLVFPLNSRIQFASFA